MREKKSVECQAVAREEEERGGAAWANEGENDGAGGEEQTTVRGEYHPEGTVEPAEMQSSIQVSFNEHNRANEQDFARQLSWLNREKENDHIS